MDKQKLADAAQAFIESFANTLDQQGLTDFSNTLQALNPTTVQRGPLPPLQHVTLQHLETMTPEITDEVMQTAVRALDWGQLYGGGGIDPVLAEGMFAAQAVGTYGVFPAQHVAAGFFLLAPNVFYPLHTHAAREVYHCLAGEIDITHKLDDAPITLIKNQSSETPSGRLHSLRTGAKPVLIAYIWMGDLTAPTWWWEQDEDNRWFRTAWRRVPGESWTADGLEPLDPADFEAAMK